MAGINRWVSLLVVASCGACSSAGADDAAETEGRPSGNYGGSGLGTGGSGPYGIGTGGSSSSSGGSGGGVPTSGVASDYSSTPGGASNQGDNYMPVGTNPFV